MTATGMPAVRTTTLARREPHVIEAYPEAEAKPKRWPLALLVGALMVGFAVLPLLIAAAQRGT